VVPRQNWSGEHEVKRECSAAGEQQEVAEHGF
jgi:hypothetical protein